MSTGGGRNRLGSSHGGRRGLTLVIGGMALIAGCAMPEPSTSTPALVQFQTSARALADDLRSLEWDFHTAVQGGDDAAARADAANAASAIEDFMEGPLRSPRIECIAELQDAIGAQLAAELNDWHARAEGRGYPTSDEISLFFAFYGADKAWMVALKAATDSCQQSAFVTGLGSP